MQPNLLAGHSRYFGVCVSKELPHQVEVMDCCFNWQWCHYPGFYAHKNSRCSSFTDFLRFVHLNCWQNIHILMTYSTFAWWTTAPDTWKWNLWGDWNQYRWVVLYEFNIFLELYSITISEFDEICKSVHHIFLRKCTKFQDDIFH